MLADGDINAWTLIYLNVSEKIQGARRSDKTSDLIILTPKTLFNIVTVTLSARFHSNKWKSLVISYEAKDNKSIRKYRHVHSLVHVHSFASINKINLGKIVIGAVKFIAYCVKSK